MKLSLRRVLIFCLSFVLFFCISFLIIINFVSFNSEGSHKSAILSDSLQAYLSAGRTEVAESEKLSFNLQNNGSFADLDYQYSQIKSENDKNYIHYTVKNKNTQNILIDLDYIIEKKTRRLGQKTTEVNSETAVVFVGCSNTFGDGVDFEQTFTALFQKKYPKVAFYNLGIRGGALNDHLYLLQKGEHFLNIKKHKNIILVYYNMMEHLFRESCSTRCLQDSYEWTLIKPHYSIVGEDSLTLDGTHADHFHKSPLTQYIFNRKFFKNRDLPPIENAENYRRHELLLSEFYQELSKKQNITGAYYFWGLGSSVNQIKPLLSYVLKTKYKPIIFDFTDQNYKNNEKYYWIPVDKHPSAAGHRAMFESLDNVLKRDNPALLKGKTN